MAFKARSIIGLAAAAFLAAAAPALAFDGPLGVTNSHPLLFAAGSPRLMDARCRSGVEMSFTYSSTFLVESSARWDFGLDLEAALLEIRARKLLNDTLEASVEVPVMSYNSGFLDGFLESYHDAFGFPDYGRSRRPHNDFLLSVSRGGNPVIRGEAGGTSLGDVRLGLKKAVLGGDPYVSVLGFVTLPTGDPDKGFGSGSVQGGLALLVNKALGERVTAYLNAGYAVTDELKALEDVPLKNYPFGGLGLEWQATRATALVAQFFIQGSPFEETGVDGVDDPPSVLAFGARFSVGEGRTLELSFSEDPTTSGAPDFMVALGYGLRF